MLIVSHGVLLLHPKLAMTYLGEAGQVLVLLGAKRLSSFHFGGEGGHSCPGTPRAGPLSAEDSFYFFPLQIDLPPPSFLVSPAAKPGDTSGF